MAGVKMTAQGLALRLIPVDFLVDDCAEEAAAFRVVGCEVDLELLPFLEAA